MKRDLLRISMFGVVSLCVAASAGAAVIVSTAQDVAPGGPAEHTPYSPALSASSSDLAEGLMAAFTGDDMYELSAGVSQWTNGSLDTVYGMGGSGGDDIDHAAYGSVQPGTTATLDLGGLFDLSQVDVFPGWNDSGRDNISFDLQVSADDVTYATIAAADKGSDDTGVYTTPVTNLYSFTDDGGADIAAAVRYVRLSITDADNGHAGIVEIDVFGAAVPEPASFALFCIAGFASVNRRRRA